jgi:hypothetical protein
MAGPGGEIQSIGSQIVDDWFMSNQVDLAKLWSVQGAHDPVNKFILWRYGSSGFAGEGYTDRALGYQYALQRWFPLRLNCAWLARASSPQILADAIDDLADDVDLSVDTRVYDGGGHSLQASQAISSLGSSQVAQSKPRLKRPTCSLHPVAARLCPASAPSSRAQTITPAPSATKATPTASVTWNSASSPNRGGMITQRADGLSHRFRVTIPAGESWSTLSAIEVDGVQPSGWA